MLVPLSFTDLSATKQRPALVISSDSFKAAHDDLLVAAITSHFGATTEITILSAGRYFFVMRRMSSSVTASYFASSPSL